MRLISHKKITKLWDYECSELGDIFSDRFCQLLQAFRVKNVEYFPVTTVCKTTKKSSGTFYKWVNIVGNVNAFTTVRDARRGTKKKVADRHAFDTLNKKIVRAGRKASFDYPTFFVDNDIKEACDTYRMTGVIFESLVFADELA